jgi:IS30 family transposase
MSYQQLTEVKRYQIAALMAQGCSQAAIARNIKASPSAISRELRRNRTPDGRYDPDYAQKLSRARRTDAAKYTVPKQTVEFVELMLSFEWSPEQISGIALRLERPVSHEWIYQHIAADKVGGGKLYLSLRQGHKRYRKGRSSKRSVIPEPVSIELRPAIVEARERFGDWEIDTVMGKQGSGAMVTIAERKSRFYLVKKVSAKTAAEVRDATIEMLRPYADFVHTITADNGSEFVEHQAIADALDADVYFAHPYSAWERGLNENFNGLLQQYIPKGTDLRQVSDADILRTQTRLNERPRKCLGFRQPKVVFNELLQAA